jgi:hypothetical protein
MAGSMAETSVEDWVAYEAELLVGPKDVYMAG